jgi:hypothetical protein
MRFGIEHLACLRLCLAPKNVAKMETLDMLPLRVRTRLGGVSGLIGLSLPSRAKDLLVSRALERASAC